MLTPFYYVLLPLFYGLIFYRRSQGKEHQERYKERFGIPSRSDTPPHPIWFHAASVGEVRSILPFLKEYIEQYPDEHILLTTNTLTTLKIIEKEGDPRFIHQFIPLDHPLFVERFLNYWRPRSCCLLESELWPCLIKMCKKKSIKLFLLNGRLSEKSQVRWKKVPSFFSNKMIGAFDHIWTASSHMKGVFESLGAQDVEVIPNFKFFSPALAYDEDEYALFRNRLIDPLITIVSTHPGEEVLLLPVFIKLRNIIPTLRLVLIPRHPSRCDSIEDLLRKHELSIQRYSSFSKENNFNSNVLLVDCVGKTGLFFALSSHVIMGGSFVDHRGHNPLEPWLYECEVFMGPYMGNFTDVLESLDAFSYQVESPSHLFDQLHHSLVNKKPFPFLKKKILNNKNELLRLIDDLCVKFK